MVSAGTMVWLTSEPMFIAGQSATFCVRFYFTTDFY